MDAQRWLEIKSAFDNIVDLDLAERAKRLTALGASDPALRAAVELLLAADSDADSPLASLDAVFFPQSVLESDPLELEGQTISHFKVHEPIGAGGIGVVYRAEDTRLRRSVALKFLLPSHSFDSSAKTRFLREAHLVAALDHPNLCTIHDIGTSDDGRFFLAMPLYPGETLKARMARGPMRVSEILDVTTQIVEGLQCAHDAGIVHRDLKPGNLMLLPDGTVKILDFGLAKAQDQSLSESGARFGTVSYMSPEQIRGETVDARSDLWAVGVVLFEMLAERKPFGGEHDISIAHAIVHDEPVPPSTHRGDMPAALEDVLFRLLEKDPSRRYSTAAELLGELTRIDPAKLGAPRRRSPRQRRWVPAAIGGTVATLAAISAAVVLSRKPAREPPDRVQLTFTGNAIAPSLSADGKRVAFAEKQCDEAGYCTYQVIIQNTDGTSRIVLVRNIGYIYKTQWISNDRFLEFSGSYPPLRHGAFAVSTRGGEPRYLGCCFFHLLSGDTAFLSGNILPGKNVAWVPRITARDGLTLDSIPVGEAGVIALTIPDRLIASVRKTLESPLEFRLIDFRGHVIHRVTPPFWANSLHAGYRWVPSSQKLVVASGRSLDRAWQREFSGTGFDILSVNVTASRIESDVDTVFSGLQIGDGLFDISPDGEQLLYSAGPVETSLSTIDVERTSTGRLSATQVLSSTTLLRGRISPTGDRIFLARDAPHRGSNASQFSLIPRDGGVESQIPGAVENFVDLEWTPDGARIMYLQGIGGNKIRLMETDTAGRGRREIARLDPSAVSQFHPLPDGSVWILPDDHSVSVIRRPGKRDVTWRVPEWISGIGRVSHSPDAKSLAVLGLNRSLDSVVVATVDIESGRFARKGIFGGSDPQSITWLNDGSIMFVLKEKQGAFALYKIPPRGPAERLGVLPYTWADFSMSNDGRHVAAFGYSDKKDVYMIRNFGKMLRR